MLKRPWDSRLNFLFGHIVAALLHPLTNTSLVQGHALQMNIHEDDLITDSPCLAQRVEF